MKKFICMALLICFILSAFSACGKKSVPGDFEDDTDINFHGSDFTFYVSHYGLFKTSGKTASNDRFNQRLYDIQDKYKLVVKEVYQENLPMSFMSGLMTGNLVADVVVDIPLCLYDLYTLNTLIPVADIIDDVSESKYGPKSLIEGAIFKDTQYGIYPYLHDTPPNIGGLLQLNMTYVNDLGLSDPHEIIEAGDWDWEHFRQYLEDVTFSDGDDKYVGLHLDGYRNGINAFATFIFSNGGSIMKYSSATGYQTAIDSPEAVEAMEYIMSLFASPYADCPGDDKTKYIISLGVPSFTASTNEYHALRAPYGPNGSADTISAIMYDCTLWAFPIFSIYDNEEVYTVIDELFNPLSDLYPNGWKDYVKDNYFYDDEDYEYYCLAADNVHFVDSNMFEELFYSSLRGILNGAETVQSSLEPLKNSIQSLIDEKYNK